LAVAKHNHFSIFDLFHAVKQLKKMQSQSLFSISEMTLADLAEVLGIYQQAIDEGESTFDTESPSEALWHEIHLPIGRLVARDSANRVVGWAALSPVSVKKALWGVAEVSVYLEAEVRGKGLGKLLLQALIQESEQHGLWSLQAAIFPENKASIALHLSLGFRFVGMREKMGQLNGLWRDVWLGELRL
jgi:phosphinothricin acetyltransferase